MEGYQQHQDRRFQFSKRKKLLRKKEEKRVKKKNVVDTPCENNINTVAEKHFSPENT